MQWKTITPANSVKFMVKGTHLASALYGRHSRYRIVEIRAYDAERNADRIYRVFDAHTVSDAEVKNGIEPKSVGTFPTLDEAKNYCDFHID